MNQLRMLLQPAGAIQAGVARRFIIVLFATSAICLLVASMLMPDGYSWLSNAISESAAQGIHFSWVARLGFLSFGFGVIWLALLLRPVWARGAYWLHLAFGVFMLSTAAFSHKPWLVNLPFDFTEDFLHSVTATGMGFAFAFGVLVRFFQRDGKDLKNRIGDLVALIAASTLSPLGELWPSIAGLLQRMLFVIAYAWYIKEVFTTSGLTGDSSNKSQQVDR